MRKFLLALSALFLPVVLLTAQPELRGPFIIMTMPYTDDGAVDYEVLAAEAAYLDDCGVSGMLYASDHHLVSYDEWKKGLLAVIEVMKDRKAVLGAVCNGETTEDMVERCRFAEKAAKKAKMKNFVLFGRPADNLRTLNGLLESLNAIGEAIHTPYIYQTWLRNKFPRIPASEMAELARKYPGVFGYVKCEVPGTDVNNYMAQMNAYRPDIKSVFSAWGSWQWLYQWRQFHTDGVISQRPAYADTYAKIWQEMEKGDPDGKVDPAFAAVLSMLMLRSSISAPDEHRSYHLYVLCKRGVFKNMVSRVKDDKDPRGYHLHTQELTPEQIAEVELRFAALQKAI
ncbi:MAG: hypothetical protein II537_00770 [Bacteroidales bacterium]|nr:hypothetical protein [Bacteroidales bacterium]